MLSDPNKRWWHKPLALITNKNDRLTAFGRAVRWMIILLVVGVLGLLATRFEFGRVRGADHFIEKASLAIAAEDWNEARRAMEQVQEEEKTNPAFLRVVAGYLTGTRSSPELLVRTLKSLAMAGKARPTDDLWMSMACHAIGETGAARSAWEKLPADLKDSQKAREVEIDLLVAEGRMQEALQAEQRLLERFRDDPEIAMRLAGKRLSAPFPELKQTATRQLLELAARDDLTGLQSLRVLVRRPSLTSTEAEACLRLADQHARLPPEDRLALVSTVMRLDPSRREPLLQSETARHEERGAAIRARLASWLIAEGEFTRFNALVADGARLHPGDVYPLKAQALVAQKKWKELLALVEKTQRIPLAPSRAAVWRALATRHLMPDRPLEARHHLEEGTRLGGAEGNVLALQGAASLAEEWGMLDLALAATRQLAKPGTQGEATMLEKCWQLAATLKDSPALAEVSARLHTLRPNDATAMKKHDYLRLLRGEEVEATLNGANAMKPQNTASAPLRLLQALKAFRMRDLPLAVTLARGIESTADLSTGEKAVLAGLLAMSKEETARAFQIAERIRPETLLAEERVFWKRAL
jgi:tetratricopeptide (TPR) repeat protein